MKPILKWAGGKRWLVPRLLKAYTGTRLVEPFAGGLSVALGLSPKEALLNDINPYLINLYNQVKAGLPVDMPFANEREAYIQYREMFNKGISENRLDGQMALLFYYLNRTGFNGLCRFNRKGGYNVSFGKRRTINYIEDFSGYRETFSGWNFTSEDFSKLQLESGDFLYVDPPYDTTFSQYSKEDFTWADQERLLGWLLEHDGPVVASNKATDRILELYWDNGFRVEILDAPRRISCNGNRDSAKEMFATRGV